MLAQRRLLSFPACCENVRKRRAASIGRMGAGLDRAEKARSTGAGAGADLAELKARAEALVPVLRERAQATEQLRRIPDETLANLHKSGIFRMLQPKRIGGSEAPYRALIDLGAILAQGCASTAWVTTNLASHHWMLGMWPKAAQDDIWNPSPDVLIGSAFAFPSGRAKAAPGGWRLKGRWGFSSGDVYKRQIFKTMSIASTNIAVRSASRLPNTSASESKPPGLTPIKKRPSRMWSIIATCAATAAGWVLGRLMVPLPSLIRLVSCARLAMNIRQEVMVSALSVTCSPMKASVKPSRSASRIASRSSRSVSPVSYTHLDVYKRQA